MHNWHCHVALTGSDCVFGLLVLGLVMQPVPLSTAKAICSVCCHPLRCHWMYRGRPDQTPTQRSLTVEIQPISQLSTPILLMRPFCPALQCRGRYHRKYRCPSLSVDKEMISQPSNPNVDAFDSVSHLLAQIQIPFGSSLPLSHAEKPGRGNSRDQSTVKPNIDASEYSPGSKEEDTIRCTAATISQIGHQEAYPWR